MRSVGAAGRDRQTDVYVGVDVFGRGCFGGGGYNSKLVCGQHVWSVGKRGCCELWVIGTCQYL